MNTSVSMRGRRMVVELQNWGGDVLAKSALMVSSASMRTLLKLLRPFSSCHPLLTSNYLTPPAIPAQQRSPANCGSRYVERANACIVMSTQNSLGLGCAAGVARESRWARDFPATSAGGFTKRASRSAVRQLRRFCYTLDMADSDREGSRPAARSRATCRKTPPPPPPGARA